MRLAEWRAVALAASCVSAERILGRAGTNNTLSASNHTSSTSTSSSSSLADLTSTGSSSASSESSSNSRPTSQSSATTSGLGSIILQGLGLTQSGSQNADTDTTPGVTSPSSTDRPSSMHSPQAFIANSSSNATIQTTSSPSGGVTETITLIAVNSTSSGTGTGGTGANATTSTTSATGSLASASACNTLQNEWSSSNLITGTTTFNYIYTESLAYQPIPNNTFTLCDGYPRNNATTAPPFSYSYSYFTDETSSVTYSLKPNVTHQPSPTCSIDPQDCALLWNSYDSDPDSSELRPACVSQTGYPTGIPCMHPSSTPTTFNSYVPPCTFQAGPVQLIYFPVTIQGSDLCGTNYTTIRSNATKPSTVVTLGTTFTEGTAYISFESLGATDTWCNTQTGTSLTNYILPLPSADVSSLCGAQMQFNQPYQYQVNFANLNPPIPLSVYSCQSKCSYGTLGPIFQSPLWTTACPVVYDDYVPELAYPTAVRFLQPEWELCWFPYYYGQNWLNDPPIALRQATSVATPTLPTPTPTPTSPPPTPTHTSRIPPPTSSPQQSQPGQPSSHSSGNNNPPGNTPSSDNPLPTTALPDNNDPPPSQSSPNNPGSNDPPSNDPPANNPSQNNPSPNDPAPSNGNPPQQTPVKNPTQTEVVVDPIGITRPPTSQQTVPISKSGSNIIVGSTTLAPGQETTISGHTISALPGGSAIAVDGTTTTLQDGQATQIALPASPTDNIPITRSGSDIIVGGTTLTPGAVATINGQTITVGSGGNSVIVGGSTVALQNGQATNVAVPNTPTDEIPISRSGANIIVDGTTLTPGSVTTIDGQAISVLQNGGIIIGTNTMTLSNGQFTEISVPAPLGGIALSRSGPNYIFGSETLTPGETTTINGVAITELPNASGIVINGMTITLGDHGMTTINPAVMGLMSEIELAASLTPTTAPAALATMITIGVSVITVFQVPGHTDEVVVDGTTLSVGGEAITIDGTTISEGDGGLVVGSNGMSSTVVDPAPSGGASGTPSATVTLETGDASSLRGVWMGASAMAAGLAVILVWL